MTAKQIPYVGEFGIPGFPAQMKIISATYGVTSDADVNLADTTQADSDGFFHVWELPKKTFVADISVWPTTAMTAGSMQIGDSASSDGYFTDTLLDPTTTTTVPKSCAAGANTNRWGKAYTDCDYIGISLAATTPSAGAGRIFMRYATEVEST